MEVMIMQKIKNRINVLFSAISFAESNCPQTAIQFLYPKQSQIVKRQATLNEFLEAIGMKNVPVYYGIAQF
jgi:hypothetical protein